MIPEIVTGMLSLSLILLVYGFFKGRRATYVLLKFLIVVTLTASVAASEDMPLVGLFGIPEQTSGLSISNSISSVDNNGIPILENGFAEGVTDSLVVDHNGNAGPGISIYNSKDGIREYDSWMMSAWAFLNDDSLKINNTPVNKTIYIV